MMSWLCSSSFLQLDIHYSTLLCHISSKEVTNTDHRISLIDRFLFKVDCPIRLVDYCPSLLQHHCVSCDLCSVCDSIQFSLCPSSISVSHVESSVRDSLSPSLKTVYYNKGLWTIYKNSSILFIVYIVGTLESIIIVLRSNSVAVLAAIILFCSMCTSLFVMVTALWLVLDRMLCACDAGQPLYRWVGVAGSK